MIVLVCVSVATSPTEIWTINLISLVFRLTCSNIFEGNGARSKPLDFDAPILICCLTSESYFKQEFRDFKQVVRNFEQKVGNIYKIANSLRGFAKGFFKIAK